MLSAIGDVIMMVLGLVLDITTLPFRALFALLGGAEFRVPAVQWLSTQVTHR
jgi:hypothetical protein